MLRKSGWAYAHPAHPLPPSLNSKSLWNLLFQKKACTARPSCRPKAITTKAGTPAGRTGSITNKKWPSHLNNNSSSPTTPGPTANTNSLPLLCKRRRPWPTNSNSSNCRPTNFRRRHNSHKCHKCSSHFHRRKTTKAGMGKTQQGLLTQKRWRPTIETTRASAK